MMTSLQFLHKSLPDLDTYRRSTKSDLRFLHNWNVKFVYKVYGFQVGWTKETRSTKENVEESGGGGSEEGWTKEGRCFKQVDDGGMVLGRLLSKSKVIPANSLSFGYKTGPKAGLMML